MTELRFLAEAVRSFVAVEDAIRQVRVALLGQSLARMTGDLASYVNPELSAWENEGGSL